jgi:hypothetical protein
MVSFTLPPLYPRGKSPGIHGKGGWVGRKAGLDVVELIPGHLTCSHYTHWAIPAVSVRISKLEIQSSLLQYPFSLHRGGNIVSVLEHHVIETYRRPEM